MTQITKADSGVAPSEPRPRGGLAGLRRCYDGLTLGKRLAFSFAAVFALVALLALAGVFFMQGVLSGVDGFSRRADLTAAAAELEISLRSLEIAVRDHLAEGDADSFDEAARHRAAMSAKLAALSAAAVGEDAKSAAAATTALENYWRGLDRIVELKAQRAELTENELPRLLAAARAPLERLKDVGGVDSAAAAAEVGAKVAAAHDMALRFADRRDMMDGQRAQNLFAAARDRLLDLNRYRWVAGTVDNMSAATAAIDALEKALERLDLLVAGQDALRADALAPNAAVIADRARALRQSGEREAERLRAGLAARAGDFGTAVLWAAAGVLALGGITVWVTARRVVRPVRDVARALTAVAQGRHEDAEAAGTTVGALAITGGDEASDLARALATVRENTRRMSQALAETSAERDRLAQEARRLAGMNDAKSDFLVNLGQLLHGPLSDLAAQTQALMISLHRHGQTEAANDAESAQWTAERLAAQLDGLMDFARIEAGRGELCLQDFDVGRLLVETRERTLVQADLRGVTVTAAAIGDVGGMHSDFAKVRQTLLNLLDNACVHADASTATLTAERIERDGRSWVAFTVSDDGAGFSPERAADLFLPFSRNGGGAGLGLTLAAHYVAMLGGEIDVISAPGCGARFALRLPAVHTAEDESRGPRMRVGAPDGQLGAVSVTSQIALKLIERASTDTL